MKAGIRASFFLSFSAKGVEFGISLWYFVFISHEKTTPHC